MIKDFNMFKKVSIGKLKLKNRFIRSATWEGLCNNGFVTDELISMYKKLAIKDVSMIITGFTSVTKYGHSNIGQMAIYDNKFVPRLKELTKEVHLNNGKICIQLAHCGGQAVKPLAPSAVSAPFYKVIPEELTLIDIEKIIAAFAKAAYRAVEANFDAIQIHAAHGYLISQFLSPVTNKRKDKYGGNIENRMRFLLDIYYKIRKVVSEDFSILLKINCDDFIVNGFTFEESLCVIKTLENIGLDAVEISGGMRGSKKTPIITNIDSEEKEAYWKEFTKIIKENVKIPVIIVGGLRSLNVINQLYYEEVADFFSFSRPLIREPDLIYKWKNSISFKSKCISCNKCFVPAFKGEGIKCIFNTD